jgi:chorismate synthase
MRSNFLQKYLGFTCFGESHGDAVGIVIEDVKPNIEFPYDLIKEALRKRRPAHSVYSSSRRELDEFYVLSGVFEGRTTGMPICIVVYNTDKRPDDYYALREIFRPGHAEYSWYQKFKIYDWRGGGRASGRETISRVIAGEMLDELIKPMEIYSYPVRIGSFEIKTINREFMADNQLKWPDSENYDALCAYLDSIKSEKDSIGAIVQCEIKYVRSGLGDPVFEKLEANIAKAVMSIGGVKGIEFGNGFQFAYMKGSESNDQIGKNGYESNHQGGITGGVSNGQDILFRVAVKAVPSIGKRQRTIDIQGNDKEIEIEGRHDVCLIPRILPVIEAMVKLCLADAVAYQNLIEEKSMNLLDYREAIDKIDEDILIALYRRMKISEAIGRYKTKNHLDVFNPERETQLFDNLCKKADMIGLDSLFVKQLWERIVDESKKRQ